MAGGEVQQKCAQIVKMDKSPPDEPLQVMNKKHIFEHISYNKPLNIIL